MRKLIRNLLKPFWGIPPDPQTTYCPSPESDESLRKNWWQAIGHRLSAISGLILSNTDLQTNKYQMQALDDKKRISHIELEIDRYRRELENILNDESIEEFYRNKILKLFREIQKDRLLIIYYKSKNQKLALYQKASDIVNKMIHVAAYAEKIGANSISKEIIKGCSFLLIEIGICHIGIVQNVFNLLKSKIGKSEELLEFIEFQTKLIELDNVKQIKETFKEYGFVDINRYFLAIICINEQLSVIKFQQKKEHKEFGKLTRHEKIIERISQISLMISDLICTALNINKNTDEDQIVTLQNITWEQYKNISEVIGDASFCRISYCDGVLELMSPGLPHEELSENTGEIIKQYCVQKKIKCFPIRSTTLENKKGKKGKQPDSSYAFYRKSKIPDIAVEINITSGKIEDLKIYAEIGVPEVWVYNDKEKRIKFFLLEKNEYKEISYSKQLDSIDSNMVNKILEIGKKGGDINDIRDAVNKLLESLNTPESSS